MEEIINIDTYLSFKIGGEDFAINASNVQSIQELVAVTKVPHSHDYMMGVINLRGKVLSVIDSHIKLGMAPIVEDENTCIVVLEMQVNGEFIEFGIMVDSVQSVYEFSETQIKPPPSVSGAQETDYITGMVEDSGKFIMILDLNKIFEPEDMLV